MSLDIINKIKNIFRKKNHIPDNFDENDFIMPSALTKIKKPTIRPVEYINTPDPNKPNVLIMDDYEGMIRLMLDDLTSDNLSDLAINLLVAGSDYAGFAVQDFIANENNPKIDIAFLDITLGGAMFNEDNKLIELDGVDIAELIWKSNPKAEIRFVTGHTLDKSHPAMFKFIDKFEKMIPNLNIVQSDLITFDSKFTYHSRIKGKSYPRSAFVYVIHKSVNRVELMLLAIHKWYKREKQCQILGFC